MSFIFRDRNDDDYLIGIPWMSKEDIDRVSDRLVLNDMLAAIAAKCVQADEAERVNNRLENFYAGML